LGLPATFLRLAGCNLRCRYCDTPYTWDSTRYDLAAHSHWLTVTEALERLLDSAPSRLVITGGEPLLQQAAIAELLALLPADTAVEVETNATVQALPALLRRVDQWNLSPKLANAGASQPQDDNLLLEFRDTAKAFLKLVIAEPADVQEADALVTKLEWPQSRVVLMPEGRTQARLAERSPFVAEAALTRGYRFSPRLHVLLWGDERGR
jgi:organic radical activating enzyme